MKNFVNNTIIWKINSELSQVIVIPRHFEYVFTDRTLLLHLAAIELVGDFISLNHGILLEISTSALGTSHMLRGVQNVFKVPVLSRKAWHTSDAG